MPLFGFRTHKKYDKAGTQAATAKVMPKEIVKNVKPAKIVNADKSSKAVAISNPKQAIALPSGTFSNTTDAIIRPHVTEKSGVLSQSNVYTFQVAKDSNKQSIEKAIKALYKVAPTKINVINVPAKRVFVRGRRGIVPGMRKAMVTVKKGEKIDFV